GLELGRRATALEVADRRVQLDEREWISFDGLVVATGAVPRRLPGTPPLEGIHLLRTLDDCLAIRSALSDVVAAGGRIVVVGAGLIGSEVAATGRSSGASVTVLEALATPLSKALGEGLGAACGTLHFETGVGRPTVAGAA